MKSIGSLVSLLFATNPSPQSISDIVNPLKDVYRELESGARKCREYSPTIKFSYVESDYDNDDDAAEHQRSKPIAVYLPGLDCFGISAIAQFPDLSKTFDLWRMTVTVHDRSSFEDLTTAVTMFIDDIWLETGQKVTLIGESFGGLVAPVVGLRLQNLAEREDRENPVEGLVLVNPATSFDSTNWDTIGSILASLRFLESTGASKLGATPYTVLGGLALSALIPDRKQFDQILSLILGLPLENLINLPELLTDMNEGFALLGNRLPADLIAHRVGQWLPVGTQIINPRLSSINIPTLVIAGEEDNFLPSKQEADRLVTIMQNCKKLSVKGSGHFILDDRVNLTEAIIYSDINPLQTVATKYDPINDWRLPPQDELKMIVDSRVQPLRRLTSPVFFSSDKHGHRWTGLGRLPSEGPLIFVANHQLFGLDLGMIIAQLIEERGLVVRGLAHPVIFSNSSSVRPGPARPGLKEDSNNPLDNRLFEKFGAVKVSPRNYYRLLQTGQNVLLFPGGVREVFHGKDEAYKLFWPEKVDFIRTAARFNATIIPLSAVGAADSVKILMDSPDIAKLPFIGELVAQSSAKTISARYDVENEDELFTPPLIVPVVPARHYFVFGKPMSTAGLNPKDKDGCEEMYQAVKGELERGLKDILQARKEDPYFDSVKRLAVEQITGKSAPTFSVDKLNK